MRGHIVQGTLLLRDEETLKNNMGTENVQGRVITSPYKGLSVLFARKKIEKLSWIYTV